MRSLMRLNDSLLSMPSNSLIDDFDRMFADVVSTTYGLKSVRQWQHNDDSVYVDIDMPGVKKDDVKIDANDNGMIRIAWSRGSGQYTQTLHVPRDCDIATTDASLDLGVLRVTLKKQQRPSPRRIEIR